VEESAQGTGQENYCYFNGHFVPDFLPAQRKVIVRGSTQLLPDLVFPLLCSEGRKKKKITAPFSSLSCIPSTELRGLGCAHSGEGSKKCFPLWTSCVDRLKTKSVSKSGRFCVSNILQKFSFNTEDCLGFWVTLAVK